MAKGTADPAAMRSPAMIRFFGGVMARALRRDFHALRMARPGPPALATGRPVLVYLNHPSWWDAALLITLALRLFPDRTGFGPIDADALRRYGFMARLGLFGLEPGRRGAATFLRTGERILADPAAMLWVTAEGRFTDPRQRPVRLMPGIAHLARRRPDLLLLPMSVEYTFWTERRPEALVRFGSPIGAEALAHLPPAEATDVLARALERVMDDLARDSFSRDPNRFVRLLAGSAGVGGVYDLWRRGRAWVKGETFHREHGTPG
ncbi:lysophospholipid acyltransferase family protein [Arenibaculum pallidiluteum]|uniref:lysophospholipid acyltransferase family protein n=1 Tax=Arenibaculum pallidiluteum TaxID=2812559 RepID=UPI001A974A44|nr:lysophospholipid acyltransferase family protein [Arenibaculum pallidiluteum]